MNLGRRACLLPLPHFVDRTRVQGATWVAIGTSLVDDDSTAGVGGIFWR